MKNKTLLIVLGVIVLLAIVFFSWRSSQQKKLAAQAQQQLLQQQLYGGSSNSPYGTSNQNGGNLAGTINSIGGAISSLTDLFGSFGGNQSGPAGNNDISAYQQFENECEMMYNSDVEVQACVQSKMAAVTS